MLDFHSCRSLRPASALGRVPPQQLAVQAGWNAQPRAFGGRTDTVDFKPFDRARGTETPAEDDLVESFAQGRVNRRDFLRRGSAIGLSIPFMGAVLAACGGDDDDT